MRSQMTKSSSAVRLDLFDSKRGLNRGRPFWIEVIWYATKCLLFLTPWPVPSKVKRCVLRWFGARVGIAVVLKPRINIHFPWKLEIGDYAWIGEEVSILNFEPIKIGSHCCISQRAFLCTGNHDYRQPDMRYRNSPLCLGDGCWIGAQSFVGPGVLIGNETVVSAGSVVTSDLPAQMVCRGNPCQPIRRRWQSETLMSSDAPQVG